MEYDDERSAMIDPMAKMTTKDQRTQSSSWAVTTPNADANFSFGVPQSQSESSTFFQNKKFNIGINT